MALCIFSKGEFAGKQIRYNYIYNFTLFLFSSQEATKMEIPKQVTKKVGYLFGRKTKCTINFWNCDRSGARHSSFKPHWIVKKDGSIICDDECSFGILESLMKEIEFAIH